MKEGHIFWFKTDQVTEVSAATPAMPIDLYPARRRRTPP